MAKFYAVMCGRVKYLCLGYLYFRLANLIFLDALVLASIYRTQKNCLHLVLLNLPYSLTCKNFALHSCYCFKNTLDYSIEDVYLLGCWMC